MLVNVPFCSQLDNRSGAGYRECFSSSVAMLLMRLGRVASDDAYNLIRRRFGDTTEAAAHVAAVRSLGLRAEFRRDWTRAKLRETLLAGEPVAVGWLHHGPASRPGGGGHWSVVVGLHPQGVILHDPFGEPDLIRGGHLPGRSGRAVRCSWANWGPRWEVDGAGSGWALTVRA